MCSSSNNNTNISMYRRFKDLGVCPGDPRISRAPCPPSHMEVDLDSLFRSRKDRYWP